MSERLGMASIVFDLSSFVAFLSSWVTEFSDKTKGAHCVYRNRHEIKRFHQSNPKLGTKTRYFAKYLRRTRGE